ncbi:hypothetical protein [Tessaracoccus sp. Z1128]
MSELIRRDFRLSAEILTAFGEISGQTAMKARGAVEDLLAQARRRRAKEPS